jgi:hypothetical protein
MVDLGPVPFRFWGVEQFYTKLPTHRQTQASACFEIDRIRMPPAHRLQCVEDVHRLVGMKNNIKEHADLASAASAKELLRCCESACLK